MWIYRLLRVLLPLCLTESSRSIGIFSKTIEEEAPFVFLAYFCCYIGSKVVYIIATARFSEAITLSAVEASVVIHISFIGITYCFNTYVQSVVIAVLQVDASVRTSSTFFGDDIHYPTYTTTSVERW